MLAYSDLKKWHRVNRAYHQDLEKICQQLVPLHSRVLELGCELGNLLDSVQPRYGLGVHPNPQLVQQAQEAYPHLNFQTGNLETFATQQYFDYIILANTLSYVENIQELLKQVRRICHPHTRIIIIFYNPGWELILKVASKLKQRVKVETSNWLAFMDIQNLLDLENLEVVKHGKRFLAPRKVPFISSLVNKYLVHLPFFNHIALTEYIVARSGSSSFAIASPQNMTCSVIIPAQNEFENIEKCVSQMPRLGCKTEILFIHGNSIDQTWDEINRVSLQYGDSHNIKVIQQKGKGKGNAVYEGLRMAQGDIIIILDSDLTVHPKELIYFFEAVASGYCELANGCRLIYPLTATAMPPLNRLANRIFAFLLSYLLNIQIKDSLCGTKAISRSSYDQILAHCSDLQDLDPFGDFYLLFGAARLALKVTDIPVRYHERTYGTSNINHYVDGLKLLRMCVHASQKFKFI